MRPELPDEWQPNSSLVLRNSDGNIIQRRFYGQDGRAIKDIDYDHDHGFGQIHAHDWDWNQIRKRQYGRHLKPGE